MTQQYVRQTMFSVISVNLIASLNYNYYIHFAATSMDASYGTYDAQKLIVCNCVYLSDALKNAYEITYKYSCEYNSQLKW